jgi:Transposase DDE domain
MTETVPFRTRPCLFFALDKALCNGRSRVLDSFYLFEGLGNNSQYEALQATREVQTTEAFRQQYAARAGVESTHEQAIRRCGLRQCRYIGLAKTHLQHLVTAVAINLIRVGEWLAGTPTAPTRCSRFAALQGAA